MTDKLEEMSNMKHELKLAKKDASELSEANKKMDVELENRQ